ncbi:MAG: nuclear transport factor 2 family protein [Caulobacter sp.]|nr:nuclear transport factor 2 family protein [Caulobacter sp.]
MRLICAALAIALAAGPAAAQTPPAGPVLPQGEALTAAIKARDAEFFEVFFTGCDATRVAAMLEPDFEMYHDREGVVATSAAPLVEGYAQSCEERKKPDAWRSRRELVAGSLKVEPIPGYGAFEEGDHIFYERKGDGPERLVGRAHFVQVWRLSPDGWRLARVLSYSHEAVE